MIATGVSSQYLKYENSRDSLNVVLSFVHCCSAGGVMHDTYSVDERRLPWPNLTLLSRQHEFPTADTTSGKVKEHYKHSYRKRKFSAFKGIPYIKPILEYLRLEEPQNPDSWSVVFEATKTHNCIQKFATFPLNGNEDCVYLNVYVPRYQPISGENLDVIVYVHGGAFISGNPDSDGSGFLMDQDIVYVSINYRIGIFGFLSSGDDEIPGNYDLKDHVFTLK
ncbi:hypothetical protein FQA39_LY01818 [Lamprigera yunnana]|nr:hypothetical protein FQA39_LY01818 [Lamprigera yunnana]